MTQSKRAVQHYWEDHPCGAADSPAAPGSSEFFLSTESTRAERDPFMVNIVRFDAWRGQSVLDVGCGIGTDTARFARAGADVYGVDMTTAGVQLTRERLESEGLAGTVIRGDAEALPFADDSFDLVYSWGVIHHTPRPDAAAAEVLRVCKPGGRVLVMVYNRRSLFAVQAWIMFGLLKGRPRSSPRRLIAARLESPGTRTFTRDEARSLVPSLQQVSVRSVITAWDLRLGRRRFLPAWTRSLVPSALGWFLVVEGAKPWVR